MTKFSQLQITYADPTNIDDEVKITFTLRKSTITYKWIERVLAAQHLGYQIDDPYRFYGFGSLEGQINSSLLSINNTIKDLNQFIKIDYSVDSVNDQDTLNKLHHIFELEHGLLDKKDCDPKFKELLCNLNLLVHRCESVARGVYPRHVVTYFGLPKSKILEPDDYQYFEADVKFGTVYINYAEIGKTLHDLMLDNDSYINKDAFQPFKHYSADFVIKFWNSTNDNLLKQCKTYYHKNFEFFQSIGYSWTDLKKSIGNIPVADINNYENVLETLEYKQFVKAVHFL